MKIDRKSVYEKFDGRCAYCGREITIKQMQVDLNFSLWSACAKCEN